MTAHNNSKYEWMELIGMFNNTTFTRSDGTIFSRIYERLTKASRRRHGALYSRATMNERFYRKGVKDALEALRKELS